MQCLYTSVRVCVCTNACMCSLAPPAGLSLEEVREYEQEMQEKTNDKVKCSHNGTGEVGASDLQSRAACVCV